jgi:hypothetical protein
VDDYIHDFSSHEPKENPENMNKLQSFAQVACVWQEITLGGIKGPEEAFSVLRNVVGIRIIGRAKILLEKVPFSGKNDKVKLAVVSGKDIGFKDNRPYSLEEWRRRFLSRGYRFPSAESIICARISRPKLNKENEEGKRYVSMMVPISVSENGKTVELIFVISRWSGVDELSTEYGDDNYSWYPEHEFIVEIP